TDLPHKGRGDSLWAASRTNRHKASDVPAPPPLVAPSLLAGGRGPGHDERVAYWRNRSDIHST
ncbi:MAG TPA: hypothetical protein PLX06_02705, partial [Fimbriimonadaceae bacterium]|nr:hypothetical protein [Fimbriimonadaceae bacterium]